jgi:hypothetical protein
MDESKTPAGTQRPKNISPVRPLTILLSLLLLTYYFYDARTAQKLTLIGVFTTNANDSNESQLTDSRRYKFETIDSSEWIFNDNILQYTTVASLTKQGRVEIEITLRAIVNDLFTNLPSLRCMIRLNKHKVLVRQVHEILQLESERVKCLLTKEEYRLVENNRIIVGVFDERSHYRDSNMTVHGKEAAFFDRTRPKLAAFKLCSCRINSLNEQLLQNLLLWVEMHQRIGVAEISLYTTDFDDSYWSRVRKKYPEKFVSIQGSHLDSRYYCSKHRDLDETPCANKYNFLFVKDQEPVHQTLMMNHCLMHSIYKYEFFGNYDPDEFILPRSLSIYELRANEPTECDKPSYKPLNIYDYIQKLIRIYGGTIVSFWFRNMLVLNATEREFENRFAGHNSTDNNNIRLRDSFTTDEVDYFKRLKSSYDLTKCLKEKYVESEAKKSKFARLMHAFVDIGGKSIYNTDYIVMINNNHPVGSVQGARSVHVANEDGFLSHFRDADFLYAGEYKDRFYVESIRDWHVDHEFVLFLASAFAKVEN